MDEDKLDNDGSEGEESEKNLWVAAIIIGILLIILIVAIATIAIWKHFKKENTTDQNWAGPSPLADGNINEDININACILGRHRSLSSISTAPIVSNELKAKENKNDSENALQGHSNQASMEEDNINNMPTLPYISSETTSFSSNAVQKSPQYLQCYSTNDESSLPPPPLPDDFQQFPFPPQTDEHPPIGEERNMQPLPLTDIQQYQANANSMKDFHHSTFNIDDQLLPPPPADFL